MTTDAPVKPAPAKRARAKRTRVERGLYRTGRAYEACVTPPGSRKPEWKWLGEMNIARARILRDEFAVEVRSHGAVVLDRTATVEEVARAALAGVEERYEAGKLAKNTWSSYRTGINLHVVPFFQGRRIHSVGPDDIVAWVEDQQDSAATSWTIRARWTALRLVFAHAARQRIIAASPADALLAHERPEAGSARRRFLTDREITSLLEHATDLRLRVAIGLMLFCGLRASEALGLVWEDVDLRRLLVHIEYQMGRDGRRAQLKTSSSRRDVQAMKQLGSLLRRHRVQSRWSAPTDLVLANGRGKTIGYWELRDEFSATREAAGLSSDVTPHVLRHTFASILIDQGRPIEFVSMAMGHSKISTTWNLYVHLFRAKQHADAAREGLETGYGAVLVGG